jgi:hypothetical protein
MLVNRTMGAVIARPRVNCPTISVDPSLARATSMPHWHAAYTRFPTKDHEIFLVNDVLFSTALPTLIADKKVNSAIWHDGSYLLLGLFVKQNSVRIPRKLFKNRKALNVWIIDLFF